ncbi:MAG: hypothetical protein LBQ46_01925 [Treponema sp.]|jgi:hypothetical protein|nr:hypothetical protein [Treponema sp.]
MANNTFLLRNTRNLTECLFESCFSIPYFWLALIDTRVIKKLGEEIKRLFLRSSRRIMSNSRTSIKLPRDYLLRNAEGGKLFFKQFHPSLLGLYSQFTAYLAAVFREGDTLELDIIEITSFTATVKSLNQVKDVVRSIQLGEDPNRYFEIFGAGRDPLSLAGDDRPYRREFGAYSPPYAGYCEALEKEQRRKSGLLGKLKNTLNNKLLGSLLPGR